MKKCKCCEVNDAIKYSKYTNGDFCSRECARNFSTKEKRKEINQKVSEKLLGRKRTEDEMLNTNWVDISKKLKKIWDDKLISANYNDLSPERIRKRVIIEQDNKCNRCHLDKWLGEDLILEIEHKNGDHTDNCRDNLEALCPNCHSLTKTWRGRNKKDKKQKIDDEKLFNTLVEYGFNMHQALLSLNLAAKGGNYKRCHKLKRLYDEINT